MFSCVSVLCYTYLHGYLGVILILSVVEIVILGIWDLKWVNVLGWKNRVWRWVVMIHRELAAYHNYTPRMVLFRGVVFLILDISIVFDVISVVKVPQKYARLFLLFYASR